MASVKDLGKGKYRVFICNGFKPDGRVNRTSKVIEAKSLVDAKKQATALEVDFKRGKQVQFAHAKTFNDLVREWREPVESEMEHKTQERYEGFLNDFMLPYFGNLKIRDIRPLVILNYLASLKKDGVRKDGKSGGYSEKTIRHHYALMHSLLQFAVDIMEEIEYNPCDKVKPPKVERHEAGYYEDEDIERLFDCLEAEYIKEVNKAGGMGDVFSFDNLNSSQRVDIFNAYMRKNYILLALVSACRRSEIIGLRVNDIDFKYNRILIKWTGHYTVDKGIYFIDHLKNGSVSKSIDMPVLMMGQLDEYIKVRTAFIKMMGWEDSGYLFISLKSGTVTTAGGPMMPDVISQWFNKFLKRNGLPKITLHGVRHTSISYLINKDVSIKKVADRAGHQNTRTTEEIYGHIYSKTRRATADEYNGMIESWVNKNK